MPSPYWLVALLAVLVVVASSGGPPQSAILIGDSLAEGMGPPMALLARASGVPFSSLPRRGTTIATWARSSWLAGVSRAGGTVLVSLGANDMLLADPLAERPELAQLLAALAPSRVVWLLPPSMPFPDKGVRQMIRDDAPEVFQLPEVPRAADRIHATPKGYQELARAAWTVVGKGP